MRRIPRLYIIIPHDVANHKVPSHYIGKTVSAELVRTFKDNRWLFDPVPVHWFNKTMLAQRLSEIKTTIQDGLEGEGEDA